MAAVERMDDAGQLEAIVSCWLCSEKVMRAASSIARDDLVSLGTCFGKFTKSGKFHLKVTCLDYLAQHAKVSPERSTVQATL
jgi:ribosome biogenesis protein Nip4